MPSNIVNKISLFDKILNNSQFCSDIALSTRYLLQNPLQ